MRNIYISAALFLLVTCLVNVGSGCTTDHRYETYYISLNGDDNNTGKSEKQAWRTVERVSTQHFSPGSKILFKGGEAFEGTIILNSKDRGTESQKIVISSFGDQRAIIKGMSNEGLKADSCDFLVVENLEFSGSGRNSGNTANGLLVRNSNNVVLNELSVNGFQHSGIQMSHCDNAVITRVHAFENGFAGIHVTGSSRDDVNYDNHNLYIGHCVAENNPGDPTVLKNHSGNGILASSVKDGVIEYCEAFNNGWDMEWTGNGPVGIWIWNSTGVIIQYCIAHHNRTNPEAADGGGFDFDGGVSNSIIQYCISHNNEGAGYGLYEFGSEKPWENNIVRYNISQDDGIINGGSVGIWKNDDRGTMRNCEIYNNTFYNSNPEGSNLWLYSNYPGINFRNNVFMYNGSLLSEGNTLKDEIFQGNLYWNLAGDKTFGGFESLEAWAKSTGKEMLESEFTGLYQDPRLQDAGKLDITDPDQIFDNITAYFPLKGSPLINNGLNLKQLFGVDPGTFDINGTPIPVSEAYDIGAIEYQEK
ncbi:MAG: right-handed parallel beta-helix repeat-containing protein [Bacteroidales bacterium]